MDCSRVQDMISAYNDRELAPDEMKLVEDHLGTCTECANASSMISNLSHLAREWRGVEDSTELRERILANARAAPPARRATGAVLAGGAVLVIFAVGAVLAFGLFRGSDGRDAGASAATCPRVQGRSWVLPPGEGGAWAPLAPGAVLEHGSRVRIERGASAEIELGGGTDVALREMSEVEVKEDGLRFSKTRGAVAVKTSSASSRNFMLTGPGFEVAVAPGSVAFVRPGAGGILHVSVLKGRAIMGGAHQVEAGTNLERTALGEVEASPLTDETVFEPFRE